MKNLLVTILIIFTFSVQSKTIYLSNKGRDSANGSINNPVKTFQKALGLHGGETDLKIIIIDKNFSLKNQIIVNSNDFPQKEMKITIEGLNKDTKTTINGFRGFYTKNLERLNTKFRTLHVVDNIQEKPSFISIKGQYYATAAHRLSNKFDQIEIQDHQFKFKGINLNGEFKMMVNGINEWRYFECPIASFKGVVGETSFKIAEECHTKDYTQSGNLPYFKYVKSISNHPLLIDKEGDFAFNHKNNTLLVNLGNSPFIFLPTRLNGSLFKFIGSANKPFRSINFKNLNFKGYDLVNESNYAALQAGAYRTYGKLRTPNAIIDMDRYVYSGSITNTKIFSNNAVGIKLNQFIQNFNISNNIIHDLSSSAIMVGSWGEARTENRKTKKIFVRDNFIKNIGLKFLDAAAIAGFTIEDSIFNYNTIINTPYTGISVGWGWSFKTREGLGGNRIQRNYLENNMKELNDGAAIYVVSANPEDKPSVITHNFISNLKSGYKPAFNGTSLSPPIYLDFGTRYSLVHANVVDKTSFKFKKHVSKEQFIFGPFFEQESAASGKSPCGKKACDIDVKSNRYFNQKSIHDRSVKNGSGSRKH